MESFVWLTAALFGDPRHEFRQQARLPSSNSSSMSGVFLTTRVDVDKPQTSMPSTVGKKQTCVGWEMKTVTNRQNLWRADRSAWHVTTCLAQHARPSDPKRI